MTSAIGGSVSGPDLTDLTDVMDVMVVGGGPAGSSCARALQKRGLRVAVLDRAEFPRDKICAGWVTPQVLELLDIDLDDYSRDGRVFQPITGFRTGTMSGREVETDFGRAVSYGIRRCEFDEYLLRRTGAELLLGESLESLERCDSGWRINGRCEARVVVGAGGHFCPVARRLGARSVEGASVVRAQEVEFAIPAGQHESVAVRPERPELHFCDDLSGYGWCFRKGDFLNIGLGRLDPAGLADHVADYTRLLAERGRVGCEIEGRFKGHAYQLYERVVPRLVDDGVLLIGDAAGLAYPQSGEGIRPAVESGVIAAGVIAEALSGPAGDVTAESLKPYAESIEARFGRPRTSSMSGWLPNRVLEGLAARLMGTGWFSRKVVIENWFLHSGEPVLEA